MKFSLVLFLFLGLAISAFATHERAGEIIYKHVDGLTYEVTIITYTYAPSLADRNELDIKWGDETSSTLPRVEKIELGNDIRRNVYRGQHTYVAGGIFPISVEDPNRNYGIVNIPNSVNTPFFIESELVINPFLGINNSVELLNPPLDYGCVNKLYIHNPGAYDPDGDSLAYKLTVCRGAGGLPILGYEYPMASNAFYIDEVTGDLFWDTPILQGEYNVAFIIEEWRYGQRIGYVTRDLQIHISACTNNPPYITTISDTCIEAGDYLSFDVTATDPDGDVVTLSATGSPFLQNSSPAFTNPALPLSGNVNVSTTFNWATNCSHIKKNYHTAYFKAIDDHDTVPLTSYKSVNILVVGPAPKNLEAAPLGTSILLNWNMSECPNAVGYNLYRKESESGFIPDYCETGVPGYTGFYKIAEFQGIEDTLYTDNNNGDGLIHGINYCYLVTAVFPDGAEGYASNEACAYLKNDLPIITNVSVESTDSQNGSMYVAWSKPTELDTIQYPKPYEYQLFRKNNSQGSDFELIASFSNLTDTLFSENQLNTLDFQYRYKLDFYCTINGDDFYVGSTYPAPSVYLSISSSDKKLDLSWNNDVPWINDTFVVYREGPTGFDSIGFSNVPAYADTGLKNGQEYCYKIKCVGQYTVPGLVFPIINNSQENCGVPRDNIPPCPPVLSVETNCETFINDLSWIYPDTCLDEDVIYYIYYASSSSSDYSIIDSTISDYYTFSTDPPSVVGCFAITALDSLWNESHYSNVECVDINACGRVWFPIVFTPNADGYNDFFFADSVNSVDINNFRLTIFNRWGGVVYETEDPFFKWDGRDQQNNQECVPGTYFYEGTVGEYSLRGPIERQVRGSLTLLR